MTQISKLKLVLKDWEDRLESMQRETLFARDHNFKIEADVLYQKHQLLNEVLMDIRLRVVDELIKM